MQPDISEFSYGYVLIEELMTRFQLKSAGAPEFATQVSEGRAGGGWDVKLPLVPVFIQLKLADRMVRRSADEARLFEQLPYYRMKVRRRQYSRQHQLLLDLESPDRIVVYAAPAFSQPEELNAAYTADTVATRSIFIAPREIGPPRDDAKHYVAFQMEPVIHAYWCSKPRKVSVLDADTLFGNVLLQCANSVAQKHEPKEFFEKLADAMLEIYRRRVHPRGPDRLDALRAVRSRRGAVVFADLAASVLFGTRLLIHRPEE